MGKREFVDKIVNRILLVVSDGTDKLTTLLESKLFLYMLAIFYMSCLFLNHQLTLKVTFTITLMIVVLIVLEAMWSM